MANILKILQRPVMNTGEDFDQPWWEVLLNDPFYMCSNSFAPMHKYIIMDEFVYIFN